MIGEIRDKIPCTASGRFTQLYQTLSTFREFEDTRVVVIFFSKTAFKTKICIKKHHRGASLKRE